MPERLMPTDDPIIDSQIEILRKQSRKPRIIAQTMSTTGAVIWPLSFLATIGSGFAYASEAINSFYPLFGSLVGQTVGIALHFTGEITFDRINLRELRSLTRTLEEHVSKKTRGEPPRKPPPREPGPSFAVPPSPPPTSPPAEAGVPSPLTLPPGGLEEGAAAEPPAPPVEEITVAVTRRLR